MPPQSNDIGPVGQRLAGLVVAARLARGMTKTQLSAALAEKGRPLTIDVVTKLESGRRRVDVDDFVALSLVLSISMDELTGVAPCSACRNMPPFGFTCNRCGKGCP
jgi:hypothetical protein